MLMKKPILFILGTMLSLSGYAAVGDTFVVDNVTYTVTADNEVAATAVERSLTDVTLPETVENESTTYTVTAVGRDAFYYSKAVTVTVPNTVTELAYGAFRSSSLASIKLGTGLKTIGDYAFAYTKLSSIELPEGLESLGGSAFASVGTLGAISFPSTLQTIGASCFYNTGLTTVDVPASLQTIGKNTFLSCKKLTAVNLAEGLTSIGEGMFQSCEKLTAVTIPASVTTIGENAFLETALTTVNVPAAVSEIGFSAFAAPSLQSITVDAANKNFVVAGHALYSADKTLLYAYPAKSTVTEVNVDPACLGIANAAFWKSSVTKVVLGDKLRAIDEYAFTFSSALADINFPKSLVYISTEAFASTGLTSVTLPEALPELGEAAFAGCTSLTTVDLPASLTYIDIRAFWGCTSLKTVNSHATTPPVLEDWYEAYESPFYNVPSTCKLHVPAAALAAYTANSNWKSVFGTNNIIGDLVTPLAPTGYSPQEDSAVASFDGVDITFGEDVTIAKTTPSVKVICGSLVAGVPVGTTVSVDGWRIVKGSAATTVRLYPEDYDSYTAPFNMEEGKDYYIQVPAGVVKTAAGQTSEAFTIHYAGAYVKPSVKLVSVDPAEDSTPTEIGVITFTFEAPVTVVSGRLGSIKSVVGSLVNGVPSGSSGPEDDWCIVSGKGSGTQVAIFPSDYDMYLTPIPVPKGKTVFIQLPAGLFRLNSSYSTVSEAMTLAYSSETSGIEEIESQLDAEAEIYTLQGVRVTEMTPGKLYIIRQGNKVTKEIAR